ncbi:MAG: RHS repeat-associated core domain-containing protein [Verrucomicrobiae bacterium]|nr:RHS repeat-associated core domain-containing protein [Verrucomicrobiae bacterium]
MSNTSRRTSLTYPNGRVVNLDYGSTGSIDDLFSLVKSAAISGESGNKVEYTRAGLGRFVKIAYPQPAVEMSMIRPGGGLEGDSGDPYDGYDRFGRVQEMRWQSSFTGTPIDAWQWGFNEASNRTWKKNLVASSGQDEAYGYDGLYQVVRDAVGTLNTNRTAIGGVPSEEEDFTYDPTGNWLGYRKDENGAPVLDRTRSNNQDNQLTQIDGSSQGVEYDRAGNATKTRPGTGGDWTKHFANTWDAWNRLVEVKDENGTSVQKNAYDGLTRRITKESGGTVTHTYWSDRWKPLEERVASATAASRSYLWGERPGHRDELVLRDRDTNGDGSLDERLFATMDYFNGTAVLNTSGVVQERYAYSAFGVRRVMAPNYTPRTTSDIDWDFGFQGQIRDEANGWYNYGYRVFVPLVGRWINRDPIKELGGFNLYRFTYNKPINRLDYLGLCSNGESILMGGQSDIALLPEGESAVGKNDKEIAELMTELMEALGNFGPAAGGSVVDFLSGAGSNAAGSASGTGKAAGDVIVDKLKEAADAYSGPGGFKFVHWSGKQEYQCCECGRPGPTKTQNIQSPRLNLEDGWASLSRALAKAIKEAQDKANDDCLGK